MCELPTRTERPYIHNGIQYVTCMEAMWGLYQDQRLICENEQDCQKALDCEDKAWSLYEILAGACEDQYPQSGCGCGGSD